MRIRAPPFLVLIMAVVGLVIDPCLHACATPAGPIIPRTKGFVIRGIQQAVVISVHAGTVACRMSHVKRLEGAGLLRVLAGFELLPQNGFVAYGIDQGCKLRFADAEALFCCHVTAQRLLRISARCFRWRLTTAPRHAEQ
jgi:hypothetical protein